MRSFAYPATLTPDREVGGFTVTFPDLPEAITQGEGRLDALSKQPIASRKRLPEESAGG